MKPKSLTINASKYVDIFLVASKEVIWTSSPLIVSLVVPKEETGRQDKYVFFL